jgi:hypothetical protein
MGRVWVMRSLTEETLVEQLNSTIARFEHTEDFLVGRIAKFTVGDKRLEGEYFEQLIGDVRNAYDCGYDEDDTLRAIEDIMYDFIANIQWPHGV